MNENNVVKYTLENVLYYTEFQSLTQKLLGNQKKNVLIISSSYDIQSMLKKYFRNNLSWFINKKDNVNYLSINRNIKKFDLTKRNIQPLDIYNDITRMVFDKGGNNFCKKLEDYGEQDIILFALEGTTNNKKSQSYMIQILPELILKQQKKNKKFCQVYQMPILSLEFTDIKQSIKQIQKVNIMEGFCSVIREICDLKIGLSYTKFFIESISKKVKNVNTVAFSFGPCQSPVLHHIINKEKKKLSQNQNVYKIILQLKVSNIILINEGDLQRFTNLQEAMNFVKKIDEVQLLRKECKKSEHLEMQALTTISLFELSGQLNITINEIKDITQSLYQQGFITSPNTENKRYNKSSKDYLDIIIKMKLFNINNQDWNPIKKFIEVNENRFKKLDFQSRQDNIQKGPIIPTIYIPQLDNFDNKTAKIYIKIVEIFLKSILHFKDNDLYKYMFKYKQIKFESQWIQNVPQITINPNICSKFKIENFKVIDGHKGFYEMDLIDSIIEKMGGNVQFAKMHINNIYNRGFLCKIQNYYYTSSLGNAYNDLLEKFCKKFIQEESRKNLLQQYDEYLQEFQTQQNQRTFQQNQKLLNIKIKNINKPYKNHLKKLQDEKQNIINAFQNKFQNFRKLILQDSNELIKCKDCNKFLYYNQIFDIIYCKTCDSNQKTGIKNLIIRDNNQMTCNKCDTQLCLIEIPIKRKYILSSQSLKDINHCYIQVCIGCNNENDIMKTCQDFIIKECKDCKENQQLILFHQNSKTGEITLFQGCIKCKRVFLICQQLNDFNLKNKKCKVCEVNLEYELTKKGKKKQQCFGCYTPQKKFFGTMFLKIFDKN